MGERDALREVFGEVIDSYSRAQAIEDGVLVDLTAVCPKEAGIFKFPVACTATVWEECIKVPAGMEGAQDLAGRAWDVCWMLLCAIRGGKGGPLTMFKLRVRNKPGEGTPPLVTLKAVCGPGDNAEPVITIMQPHED